MKKQAVVCVFAMIFALGGLRAAGQMVIHAMTGTIRSASSGTLVATANGAPVTFALKQRGGVSYHFDGDLRSDSVAANDFHSIGAYAAIYYYESATGKTAVAVKDLGKGPFERTIGTVKKFDKHDHRLMIAASTGAVQTITVSDKAVIDTGLGTEPGRKVDPHEGSHVRVVSVIDGGQKTAVFIRLRR